MQGYFAIISLLLMMIMVIIRAKQLGKKGIKAFKFGELDKKDFFIIPFALLFFYLIFSNVFDLPKLGTKLFTNEVFSWIGVVLCTMGLVLFSLSIISFGKSFRVGIDEEKPGELITTGVFAISRNPIYTAFGFVLIGIFLILTNWILLLYVFAGFWLFNRQVQLEEKSLKKIYGEEYEAYCKKVRKYL
ncbi:methyltransferase family protein [Priestia megaterium]|jgi:protein-S-isoprenylcysteine O-methyltransferase Ste14|uniref:methyltransferase family protein n=1 Tax=Priestia megaterium TaxID=1404 RepID=UPI0021C20B58|nr:isoprenylcysteine carboxylmethyltransferase family protein [Priestia megaterium]MCT9856530.1 isoprenylcysteine carboxylmethyltransferase family protein [Priestia megaterium]MDF1961053.1 isoprenylcysteine carboxylmethyltransferase family protein [Priestia megaterium]MDF2058538.1 isoprenylcysteine carboxylmethyltransferase family protein [Priestia megaterium]MDF2064745.1 isoprenylcysteine carboxylmethyltransferase family protein [Priestia megaterium]NGY75831.1 isoprenylcysteine carboxylmethyl